MSSNSPSNNIKAVLATTIFGIAAAGQGTLLSVLRQKPENNAPSPKPPSAE